MKRRRNFGMWPPAGGAGEDWLFILKKTHYGRMGPLIKIRQREIDRTVNSAYIARCYCRGGEIGRRASFRC